MTIHRYMCVKNKYGEWKITVREFSCELDKYKNYYVITTPDNLYLGRGINKDKVGKLYDKSNYIMWGFVDQGHDEDYFRLLIVNRKVQMINQLERKINKIKNEIADLSY